MVPAIEHRFVMSLLATTDKLVSPLPVHSPLRNHLRALGFRKSFSGHGLLRSSLFQCQQRISWARSHLPPACESPPEPNTTIRPSDLVCHTRLGGLLKSYERRAA